VDCGADLFWSILPGLQGEVDTYFAHLFPRIGDDIPHKFGQQINFHMVPTPQKRNIIKSKHNEGLNQ
jgi:hypothetical protein